MRATALFLALITLIFSLSLTPVSSASDKSVEEANNSVISGRLEEEMKDAAEDTTFYVMLWFIDDSKADISSRMINKLGISEEEWKIPLSDKTTVDEIHEYKTLKAQISAEVYTKNNNNIANKYFSSEEINYISRYSPVILAHLSKERILNIADSENIDSIDLYFGDKATTCSSPADEMEASRATLAKNTYGYDGTGVKVGIVDINVPYLDAAPGNGLPSGCVYYIDPDGVEVAGSTMDLYILNTESGGYYTYSTTSANNVEMVTFTPPSAGTYTIRVHQYAASSTGTTAYFAVAWN